MSFGSMFHIILGLIKTRDSDQKLGNKKTVGHIEEEEK